MKTLLLTRLYSLGDQVNSVTGNVKMEMDKVVDGIAIVAIVAGLIACMFGKTGKKVGISVILTAVVCYIIYLIIASGGLDLLKGIDG